MDYYDDFIIEIGEKGATSSIFKGVKKESRLDFSDTALKDAVEPDPVTSEYKPLKLDKGEAEDIGDKLFNALFREEIFTQFKSAYDDSLNSDPIVGLRILIQTSEYAVYPWELMRYGGLFLATDKQTPLLRIFPGRINAKQLGEKLLKIVVILSQVGGQDPINTGGEWQIIDTALKNNPYISKPLERVEPATRKNILNKMSTISQSGTPCNIIHFVGHGEFRDEKGYLLLPDEDFKGDEIDQGIVRTLFLNEQSVGLIVLNSCDTAKISHFSGLVPELLTRIPAVVAMRQPISNDAALSFAENFYPFLMSNRVEEIMQLTRQRMMLDTKCKAVDFSIPVLYLGWRDNKTARTIFELNYNKKTETGPVAGRQNEASIIVQSLSSLGKHFGSLEKTIVSMIGNSDQSLACLALFPDVWLPNLTAVRKGSEDIKTLICKTFISCEKEATQYCLDLSKFLDNVISSIKKGSTSDLDVAWKQTKEKYDDLVKLYSNIAVSKPEGTG